MSQFKHISVEQTQAMLEADEIKMVDIRDPQSFDMGHIESAVRLDNQNLQEFLNSTEPSTPVVVYCYHGISSQQAAQFLVEQGFAEVYSMDGGFEAWRQQSVSE